ncbi:hypothetical protein CAF53_19240 [Sphingobium sp. LB126]|uniref:hypothetical protein n=1 Tax=Sphingobium sp. LB126 TaxID=1983755 RepID=UPI000C2089C0|nr:hypothetical protein [Sphingobium sp. LB126]PJG46329.1 hypothetical protein CAF53_19240 [Sphingobium sp. LB126]
MRIPLEAAIGAGTIITTASYALFSAVRHPAALAMTIGNDVPLRWVVATLFLIFTPSLFLLGGSRAARIWVSLIIIIDTALMVTIVRHIGLEAALKTIPAKLAVMHLCGIVALWMPRSNAWFNDRPADA